MRSIGLRTPKCSVSRRKINARAPGVTGIDQAVHVEAPAQLAQQIEHLLGAGQRFQGKALWDGRVAAIG
jgi:hypothetical protein